MARFITAALAGGLALAAASASAAPVQWTVYSGGNGHWYEFLINNRGLSNADLEASVEASSFMGASGYLATITSAEEQVFLNSIWPGPGTVTGQFGGWSFYLIGASDREEEGVFRWIGGPEEGEVLSYTNWAGNEPNNNGGLEQYTFAWWTDSALGIWNDGGNDGSASGAYLVEYSDAPAPIPLPAGLPLLIAGLGGLALLRRR